MGVVRAAPGAQDWDPDPGVGGREDAGPHLLGTFTRVRVVGCTATFSGTLGGMEQFQ